MTPEERRGHVKQMVLDSVPRLAMAENLGVHPTTIREDIKKLRADGQLPAHVRRPRSTKSVTRPAQNGSQNAPNRAEQAVLRAKAFELKLQGMSYRKIAATLGRSTRTIMDWIQAEIEELITPRVEEYRNVQVATLESYLGYLQPKISRGDDKAINAAIRISEQIARLCGLNKPVRLDVTHHDLDKADAELADMVNEAKAKMALEEQQLRDQANAERRTGN